MKALSVLPAVYLFHCPFYLPFDAHVDSARQPSPAEKLAIHGLGMHLRNRKLFRSRDKRILFFTMDCPAISSIHFQLRRVTAGVIRYRSHTENQMIHLKDFSNTSQSPAK
jgi:hypothetical protein